MRLNFVRVFAAASVCLFSWTTCVVDAFAPTPIGWTALYSDSSNGALVLANFDSGTIAPLGVTWNAHGTFGGSWAVYSRFDPVSWQNAFYYREYGEGKPEKTLFSGAWMSYFDSKTWNFAYGEYDPATSEQRHFKGNVASVSTPELVLTGTNLWISSWSDNMDRYVYVAHDVATNVYNAKFVDRTTGESLDFGPTNSQSGTISKNVSYRFVWDKNFLYRYEYQYDSSDWSSHNSVSVLDVSDFLNPTSIPLGFDLWNNGSILGRRWSDLFYVTYDQNWMQAYHVRKADWTTKDFSMPSWPAYDYSTGEMAGFWTYLVYSNWNPETGKNSVRYLDYETGETGEFLSWQYVQASALNLSPALPCEGDFIACGLPFKTYAELKAFPIKRYSNVLGFVGTDFSQTAGVSHSQSIWFQWGGTGFSTGAPSYWNLVWFVWSPNSAADLKAPSRFANVGQVSDTYSVGNVSRRLSVSSPIGSYGSPVKNAGLVGRYAPIGCFQDDWDDVPSDSSANPQTEMPKAGDDSLLAQISGSFAETLLFKQENQSEHETQKPEDQIDPVDLSTGEFTYDNTVLRSAWAILPFELSLNYRSRTVYDGPLGWNWTHNYDQKIRKNADGSITYADGWSRSFLFVPEWQGFAHLKGLEADLVKVPEGWYEISFLGWAKKRFGESGMLASVTDAFWNRMEFGYDSASRLTFVSDSNGKRFVFSYGTNWRISEVAEAGGTRKARFSYFDGTVWSGSLNDLASIETEYASDSKKTVSFTYAFGAYDDSLDHNLLTITDAKGQLYVRNEYMAADRVASQWFWDGTGRFDYTLAPIREDDAPSNPGTGKIIGQYVSRNYATNKRWIGTEYLFDRLGNVLERTTFEPHGTGSYVTSYQYDSIGRLLSETLPGWGGTTYAYDAEGNRISERRKSDMSEPDNSLVDIVSTYRYGTGSLAKLLVGTTTPDGTSTRYDYDAKRKLIATHVDGVTLAEWTDLVTVTSRIEYDLKWRVSKTVDALGRETEFSYSGALLVSTKKGGNSPDAIIETIEYDAAGNPIKTIDGEGHYVSVEYDGFSRPIKTVTETGTIKRIAYDANDNVVSSGVRVLGQDWTLSESAFDVLDKPSSVAASIGDGRAAVSTFAYDGNGNMVSAVSPKWTKTVTDYDWGDRPKSRTRIRPGENSWASSTADYDGDGNMVKKTDENGNATIYAYDWLGRLAKTVSPMGGETRFAYDKAGNPVRTLTLTATGLVIADSSVTYNAIGKPLSATAFDLDAEGNRKPEWTGTDRTTKREWNADGSLSKSYDALGNVTQYEYDVFGRPKTIRDPLGNEVRYSYDRRSLVTKTETVGNDGKTVTEHRSYDADGRLVSVSQTEGGTTLSDVFAYDGLGNVISKTDAEGRTTTYAYDHLGNMVSETDALWWTVSHFYDLEGNLTATTDTEGRTTTYAYDGLWRLSSKTMPDGSTYSYAYDAAGNAVSKTDPNGTSVAIAYDAENRPVSEIATKAPGIFWPDSVTYAYDAAWRLESATDSDGKTVSHAYDPFGGISSETQNWRTVAYGYDRRGFETSLTLPSGRAFWVARDAAWRPASVSSAISGWSAQNVASYSYLGNHLSAVSHGNGIFENRTYDAFGRLASLSHAKPDAGKIRDWTYSYDRNGNALSDGTDAWSYDPLYRLREVSYGLSGSGTWLPFPEAFAYSAGGNRTSRGFGTPDGSLSGSTSYYANQLDQYVSAEKSGTSGTGSDAYSYDLNGNLLETARYRFGYDWKDRLVRVTEKARAVPVGTGSERKEIWLGSETGSGEGVPPAEPPPATEPPPAEPGTSSWTETPQSEPVPESGTSSWTEAPTGTGSESWSGETSSGTVESGSWTSESGSGKEDGSWSLSGSGCVSWFTWWICDGTGNPQPPNPGGTMGPGSWTGSWTGSETQSGATSSWTAEPGPTVTEITHPERLVAEYAYDPLGRRVSKHLSDRTVSYLYAGRKIVEETVSDLSGNVLRSSEFVYWAAGDDDVLAEFRTESGATLALYFAKDRLGSTAAVTDGSWIVLEEYRHSAFWSPYRKLPDGTWEALGSETETLSGTVRPEPLTDRLYTGREWDAETGLHHYRARAYSPELGRFLQRDPAWQSDQVNPYAYVRNNPANFTDPTGAVSDSTKTRLWWVAKIGLWFGQSLAGWWLAVAGGWACGTLVGCVVGAPAMVYWADQVMEWQALVSDGVRQLWSWGEVSQATDFATRFNPVSWWLNKTGLGCESKAIIKTWIDLAAWFGTKALWNMAVRKFGIKTTASEIRFSQRTVGWARYDEIYETMKNKWYSWEPIDVVRNAEGKLVSMDNRRLLATINLAKEKIPAVVHEMDEVLPEAMIAFKRFWSEAKTWGDALYNRTVVKNGLTLNWTFELPRINY